MRAEESTSLCDTKFKVVFLGEMGVGKTSIIERFVKDEMDQANNPTVGIDFLCRNFVFKNKTYRLQLWDTAGQEKYKSLVPAYLRDASCAVFVFDLTRQETLQNLTSWIQLYRDFNKNDSSFPLIIGNKADLANQASAQKIIPRQMIDKFANEEQARFMQVSAKSGLGVNEIFESMIEALLTPQADGEVVATIDQQASKFLQKYKEIKVSTGTTRKPPCCYV